MRFYIILSLILTNSFYLLAQNTPSNRLINWKNAGLKTQTKPTNIINVFTLGIDTTGAIPCQTILQNSINNQTNGAIYFFPKGKYLLNNTIQLKSNIVLQGEGSNNTVFFFNGNGANDAFQMHGSYLTNNVKINQSIYKYQTSLTTDTNLLPLGYYRLSADDTTLMFSSWAYRSTGQIFKVNSVNNSIPYIANLDAEARMNYLASSNINLQQLQPIENAGIECVKIKRLDSTGDQTRNINLKLAVNCWVKGVESENCNFAHICIEESKNCTVSQSWFHHAFGYGDGGKAYGVVCQFAASDNLIFDNNFNHLRHSMLLQAGANGNVYAYNYSSDVNWTNVVPNAAGDIAIHGNFPYCNLFEGNIVSHIWSDNSHGKNGPYNTFLRNRVTNYGITITSGDSINFIANEITNYTFGYGNYNIGPSVGHYLYGNNILNATNTYQISPSNSSTSTDTSFAFSSIPNQLIYHQTWPLIGLPKPPVFKPNTAKDRFGTIQTTACTEIATSILNNENFQNEIIYPSPANEYIYLKGIEPNRIYKLEIYSLQGERIYQSNFYPTNGINCSTFKKGIYILVINQFLKEKILIQ